MIFNKIHWLGVGLSSPPGVLYLHEKGHDLEVWNRSVDKASKLLNNRLTINHLNFDDLKKKLKANDIIVSMLPASMHYDIAKLAIYKKCHLITSSYFDNKYAELETQFIKNNCLFLNETGLDPGIDHLLSHKLFHQFKKSISPSLVDEISILSMCGGFPHIPNKFKYKFSWSPLGVLRALNTPCKFIKNYKEETSDKAFRQISKMNFNGEEFEIYPNRDSTPYLKEYLSKEYIDKVKNFQRGTIRLKGWSKEWNKIFLKLDENSNLEKISSELWDKNKYQTNEKDRILLFVRFFAKYQNKIVYDKTLYIDESRNIENSAMSQCVSLTMVSVIESLIKNNTKPGISRIFNEINRVDFILDKLNNFGIKIKET